MTALAEPLIRKSVQNSPPAPKRWTCAEFQRLRGEGWFEGRRSILLDGEILTMPSALPPHVVALGLVDDWLRLIFAVGHHVRNQSAFDVGTDNDPEPDLAVVPGKRRDYSQFQASQAVMVVEVSDSSLSIDLNRKAPLYAQASVPEYWVLDVNKRQMRVFRNPISDTAAPRGHRYAEHTVYAETESISPLDRPDAKVIVADLLS